MLWRICCVAVVAFVAAGPATAQSSSCQWIGNIWTCNNTSVSRGSGIHWDTLQTPDVVGNAMRGFEEGRRARQEQERARLEAESLEAQRDYYRSQTQPPAQSVPVPAQIGQVDYRQIWLEAAKPRRHLFPDFDQVVFAPNVAITPQMVMFMSGSTFAADFAYYLGKHRAEAIAIASMAPLDAAKAIDQIEAKAKAEAAMPAGH